MKKIVLAVATLVTMSSIALDNAEVKAEPRQRIDVVESTVSLGTHREFSNDVRQF